MDVLISPLLTAILNIVATGLTSKGIIAVQNHDAFIQTINNGMAAFITLAVSVYSIYKMVDLHKHSLTTQASQSSLTVTTPNSQQQTGTSTVTQTLPIDQSGKPVA